LGIRRFRGKTWKREGTANTCGTSIDTVVWAAVNRTHYSAESDYGL